MLLQPCFAAIKKNFKDSEECCSIKDLESFHSLLQSLKNGSKRSLKKVLQNAGLNIAMSPVLDSRTGKIITKDVDMTVTLPEGGVKVRLEVRSRPKSLSEMDKELLRTFKQLDLELAKYEGVHDIYRIVFAEDDGSMQVISLGLD